MIIGSRLLDTPTWATTRRWSPRDPARGGGWCVVGTRREKMTSSRTARCL